MPGMRVPARCPQSLHPDTRRSPVEWLWDHLAASRPEVLLPQPTCPRRIFTERLPGVVAPWARRTRRLTARLLAIGLALGGAAGARLSQSFGLPVSRNTLLRVIRRAPCPAMPAAGPQRGRFRAAEAPHLRHAPAGPRPAAALGPAPRPGSPTVARWLQAHPGVEVVVRDRAEAYAEAARLGAPTALQVADRFHLLQNLADVLTDVFRAHAPQLARVNAQDTAMPPPVHDPASPATDPQPVHRATRAPTALHPGSGPCRRAAGPAGGDLRAGLDVPSAGLDPGCHCDQVGLSRRTVQRYLQSPTFPERQPRHGRGRSLLDPYKATLLAGWNSGCRNGWHLFRTIRSQGFQGQYGMVALYVRRMRQAQRLAPGQRRSAQPLPAVTEAPRRPLTPRRATWLVLRPSERATAQDHHQLAQLTTAGARAGGGGRARTGLRRPRPPAPADPARTWLARAATSTLPPFRRFAKGSVRTMPPSRPP